MSSVCTPNFKTPNCLLSLHLYYKMIIYCYIVINILRQQEKTVSSLNVQEKEAKKNFG